MITKEVLFYKYMILMLVGDNRGCFGHRHTQTRNFLDTFREVLVTFNYLYNYLYNELYLDLYMDIFFYNYTFYNINFRI